jgi:hypothetical protein
MVARPGAVRIAIEDDLCVFDPAVRLRVRVV